LVTRFNTISCPRKPGPPYEKQQEPYSNQILEEILELTRNNQKLLRNPDTEVGKDIETLKMQVSKLCDIWESERPSSYSSKKRRKLHPMMLDELMNISPRFQSNLIGFQILISLFKNEFPWLFDSGLDLVRVLKSNNPERDKYDSIKAYLELVEFSFQHPMMREMYMNDKEIYMLGKDLPHIMERMLRQYT